MMGKRTKLSQLILPLAVLFIFLGSLVAWLVFGVPSPEEVLRRQLHDNYSIRQVQETGVAFPPYVAYVEDPDGKTRVYKYNSKGGSWWEDRSATADMGEKGGLEDHSATDLSDR